MSNLEFVKEKKYKHEPPHQGDRNKKLFLEHEPTCVFSSWESGEGDGMTETSAMNIPVKCEIPHMLPGN